RKGRRVASGKGLAFWFTRLGSGIAEIPTDDRELQFLFHGRSRDFQGITIQGELTYRVVDAERLAERIDFSIDLQHGLHLKQPLEQLATLFTGTAQQHATSYLAAKDVRELVAVNPDELQQALECGFLDNPVFEDMGLQMVSLRIMDIKPTPELEKALQTPTRERIQQDADEATFKRRAMAVDKESEIAENELQNRIDLATREEQLITQEGSNERRRVEETATAEELAAKARFAREIMETEATVTRENLLTESDSQQRAIRARADSEAQRLAADTSAQNRRVTSVAEAEAIRAEGSADAERIEATGLAEAVGIRERMRVYETLPANVVLALAVQEIAGKLTSIEHLNITPDVLQTNLADLFQAGAKKLGGAGGDA
ncbi:MAG: SPFH domain-containing protein, partial [Gammaproteobacteria bacterium]|nr:SPFH domain-containing protein [Gammaproteobacteria bacterium]